MTTVKATVLIMSRYRDLETEFFINILKTNKK